FVTGELMTDVNSASQTGPGAIFYVNPGMPSGTPVSLFALTPGIIEPEGLQFVTSNSLSCSYNGYIYFVSSYSSGPHIDTALYTSAQIHAILETNNAGGNAVTILGHQLIAAIANYDNGAKQTAAASAAIALSISLLCTNHIDLQTSFVQAGTSLGQQLTALAN